jgi:hypothetical protein
MADNFSVYFTHPEVQSQLLNSPLATQFRTSVRPCIQGDGSLVVPTGANTIKWGYGLNTVTYQTYGGEVVQILSAYITDMNIGGDVQSYYQMEDIYLWFLVYMNVATQGPNDPGQPGVSSFNEEPVNMWYPHREWNFQLRPKALPGLHMGRDVVAPTWQMTASVVEADVDAEAFTLQGAMEGLKEIQAGIGYEEENPFSTVNGGAYNHAYVMDTGAKIADWFNTLISKYQSQDFEDLKVYEPGAGSKPVTAAKTPVKPGTGGGAITVSPFTTAVNPNLLGP